MALIDIVTFRLAEGATEATFLEADKEAQCGFTYQQPGLVRRTTARSDTGEWLVMTLWDSAADADQARQRASGHPALTAFVAALDETTVRVARFETLD